MPDVVRRQLQAAFDRGYAKAQRELWSEAKAWVDSEAARKAYERGLREGRRQVTSGKASNTGSRAKGVASKQHMTRDTRLGTYAGYKKPQVKTSSSSR